jgi:hypothetical protein
VLSLLWADQLMEHYLACRLGLPSRHWRARGYQPVCRLPGFRKTLRKKPSGAR